MRTPGAIAYSDFYVAQPDDFLQTITRRESPRQQLPATGTPAMGAGPGCINEPTITAEGWPQIDCRTAGSAASVEFADQRAVGLLCPGDVEEKKIQ